MQDTSISYTQDKRCTSARDALQRSAGNCGNAFYAFQSALLSSANVTVQNNLNTICQQSSCRNVVSEYLDACGDIGDVSNNVTCVGSWVLFVLFTCSVAYSVNTIHAFLYACASVKCDIVRALVNWN